VWCFAAQWLKEEGQTTQWLKEEGQNHKNDLQNTTQKTKSRATCFMDSNLLQMNK
jgi:hypothetical protein